MKDKTCESTRYVSYEPKAFNSTDVNAHPSDPEVYKNRFLENWSDLTKIRKPIIAAVSGYAVSPPVLLAQSSACLTNALPLHSSVAAASSR